MLDIRGKTVGFIGLLKAEAETSAQDLRRRGARAVVFGDATANIVFGKPGAMFERALADGIEVHDLSVLKNVLEAAPSDAEPFLDFAALAAGPSDRIRDALGDLDWTRFVPLRDLVPLRSLLTRLEAESGVGDAHRSCTERLLGMGARAMHGHRHRSGVTSFALSPSGEHLATGSRCGDDYAAGGTLQIWEVATGRSVNVSSNPLRGGVGWPRHGDCIQWSRDGERLGVAYDTNFVADVAPFGSLYPRTDVVVTNGGDRPPPWCWAPNGRQLAVSGECGGEVRGIREGICIAEINTSPVWIGTVRAADATWFPETIPAAMAKALGRNDGNGPKVLGPSHIAWTRDGARILGHSKAGHAFAMDASSGDLTWVAKVANPVAWSPDDGTVAHCLAGLVLCDAATGLPAASFPELLGASSLHWAPCTSPSRLAVVVTEENDFDAEAGVHIVEEGRLLCRLDVNPHPDPASVSDARSWAWSRDGAKGACLDTEGKVHVWSVTKAPVELSVFDVPEETFSIAWGAGDVVIAVGAETLAFYEAETGKPFARREVGPLPEAPPSHQRVREDLGRYSRDYFPIRRGKDQAIAIAFESGLVVCPNDLKASIDEEVVLVLEHRWSWPFRWGPEAIVGSLAEALSHPLCPPSLAKNANLVAKSKEKPVAVKKLAAKKPAAGKKKPAAKKKAAAAKKKAAAAKKKPAAKKKRRS